jgi:hypothetical protein
VVVEAVEQVGPALLAVFNGVEFNLKIGGVLGIKDVGEVFNQQAGNDGANLGGNELRADLFDVIAVLDGVNDGGIGGGASDAALLEYLDQRGLVVTGRGFGGLLLRIELLQVERLALI